MCVLALCQIFGYFVYDDYCCSAVCFIEIDSGICHLWAKAWFKVKFKVGKKGNRLSNRMQTKEADTKSDLQMNYSL